ncbi:MAG: hypothetical protein Ct9H300mP19_04480 [Dehalococcoidia bacterium]|nr:MAG: hypothetical protein Ct9H300mP19_04480 [Dehalococcoidia bacterium]
MQIRVEIDRDDLNGSRVMAVIEKIKKVQRTDDSNDGYGPDSVIDPLELARYQRGKRR